MKTKAPRVRGYAVGCEPDRPYNRVQIALLRLLGLVLGRHIV
jgi:hypothetical protein